MSKLATNALRGLRILVAEDNMLIGESIRQVLMDMDCTVVGPIADLGEVLDAIGMTPFDGALLDVQLGEQDILPAARELKRRGIPFILATGRGRAEMSASFDDAPLLMKPFDLPELERLLRKTVQPSHWA